MWACRPSPRRSRHRFSSTTTKGFFHDFSSGKHGDLIGFLQETERLTFREAVERLAGEAGMALPVEDPRAAEREQQRQGLQDWLEMAAKWFEGELKRPAGSAARDYLARRGLPDKDWARFGIGFAPSGRTGLKDYLVAKGAKPGELIEAGLLIAPEDGGSPYDRFRDRIIFPITDSRGRIISFGGRAMDPEARAKYLNGPETSVFHKGSTLYGMAEARKLLHTGGEGAALVVVEGYMDVIACQRAGVAAVAAMGTALTEEQMAALWRLHPEPTLCFDGDSAGQRAAFRTLDRALPLLKPGRSFKFALVAGGKDPDEVLREQGAVVLKEQLAQTRPFVDVLFEREKTAAGDLGTPERLTAFKVNLRRLAGVIADRELGGAYSEALLARYNVIRAAAAAERRVVRADNKLGRVDARGRRRFEEPPSRAMQITIEAARALSESITPWLASVIYCMLINLAFLDDSAELIENQGLGDDRLNDFAKAIVRLRIKEPNLDVAAFTTHLAALGYQMVLERIGQGSAKSGAPFVAPDFPDALKRAIWSHTFERVLEWHYLERAIERTKSEDNIEFDVLNGLKMRRDAAKRSLASGDVWIEPVDVSGEQIIHYDESLVRSL